MIRFAVEMPDRSELLDTGSEGPVSTGGMSFDSWLDARLALAPAERHAAELDELAEASAAQDKARGTAKGTSRQGGAFSRSAMIATSTSSNLGTRLIGFQVETRLGDHESS